MMPLQKRATGRFPFAHTWCRRSALMMTGWEFGFYFAPWPREEHFEGDMVRALAHLDGYVSLKLRRFRIWFWTANPAERFIGER